MEEYENIFKGKIGIILSNSSTQEATFQFFEKIGKEIKSNQLLIIKRRNSEDLILSRIAEIYPFHGFYQEGDIFSEARRKNYEIPSNIANEYIIGKLDLLREIPSQSGVTYPPEPGDGVFTLDENITTKQIFGIKRNEPGFVWFGELSGYKNIPAPIDIEKLPLHLAIFGVTGSGKSFNTGVLIEKLSKIPVNENTRLAYPLIIVDAHGDYTEYADYFNENKEFGSYGNVYRLVFPKFYDSMKERPDNIDFLSFNLDFLTPREISELIALFYRGSLDNAELMIQGLNTVFQNLIDEQAWSIHNLISNNMNVIRNGIRENNEIHSSTKAAMIRAIENFFQVIENDHRLLSSQGSPLQDPHFIDRLTKNMEMVILDFSAEGAPGVNSATKQFVISYLSSFMFNAFTNYKIKNDQRFAMLMIEEAQNFCPSPSYSSGLNLAKEKLSAIATQGRKFGLSLCLISQRPAFLDKIVVSMCNSFLIQRVSHEDISFVNTVTGGLPISLSRRLTNLKTGEVIISGQLTSINYPILVNVPKIREVYAKRGKNEVLNSLKKIYQV